MLVSCIHADRCPGCALIGRAYPEQLAHKRAAVTAAMARYATLADLPIEELAGAEHITGYRVRSKLAVAGSRVGTYLPGSHEVLDIPECRVTSAPAGRVLSALRARLTKEPLGGLTAVDLRVADPGGGIDAGRVLLTLIVDSDRLAPRSQWQDLASELSAACPELAGVSLSAGEPGGPRLLGAEPEHLFGERELLDVVAGVQTIAVPGAFVQAHREQAARLVGEVTAALEAALGELSGKRLLDLYGGSGGIGLALAARGADVTIVETYRRAAAAAERAARGSGARARVVCADVARFLAETTERWDGVVVNPPRRGLSPEVRARVAALGARSALYVSCNPETLARDLADFARLGLAAQGVLPLDMIPLTEEVESLVALTPARVPAPHVLYQDAELVVVDKPAHEPTLPRPDRASSLLQRVRLLPGCERATPLEPLDVETSGVCVFARSPAASARWSAASSSADRRYVALARGVWSARGAIKRGRAGQHAGRTRYRRLRVVLGQSLLEITPEVGAKPQIRRHLASIGHPLVGDARHGHAATNRHFAERYGLDRSFLHCARIEIAIPGEVARVFEAPLAGDLASVLAQEPGSLPRAGSAVAKEIPDT